MNTGTLYIVSTPIGNLGDITFRAVETLKSVDLIAAEDTRRTTTLLAHCGIRNTLTSYHSYNLKTKTKELVSMLAGGKRIALVSDSGTPGISDPGSVLVSECIKNGIPLVIVPGPAAFVAALVLSGRPTNKFVFEGFLSNKSSRRRKQLEKLREEERTVIVYESPHRIVKFLADFADIMGDREIVLAREITKKFEEVTRGPAGWHLKMLEAQKPRGEYIAVF